jgi:transcriptional regulator with XRE-family HTH domain
MAGPLYEDVDCRKFGENLKVMREFAKVSQDELAAKMGYSGSVIASIEAFHRAPTVDQGERADEAFHLQGFFGPLAAKIRGRSFPEPFVSFADHEKQATTLFVFEHSWFPGLLQTEDYARAVLERHPNVTADEVIRRVEARTARQAVLTRADPHPIMAWFLIDEQVLYREIGGPKVMHDQLMRAAEMAALPNVSIQVIRRTGAHPGLLGAFTIAETRNQLTMVNVEDIIDGRVSDGPAMVAEVTLRYRYLASMAFPADVSRDMIMKVAEEQQWQALPAPRGASPVTAAPTAASASRLEAPRGASQATAAVAAARASRRATRAAWSWSVTRPTVTEARSPSARRPGRRSPSA